MSEDRLLDAKRQGQAQFDSIREMVEALNDQTWVASEITDEQVRQVMHFGPIEGETLMVSERVITEQDRTDVAAEFNSTESCFDERLENARRAIEEDALSVEVRSDWYVPGAREHLRNAPDVLQPIEYRILLCTGGPACQITGQLSEHGEPETAVMQVQDWFQPWTEYRPTVPEGETEWEEVLLAYARVFWFGE